jgi:hypothetical protein
MEDNTRNMKAVFTITERGGANGMTKSYWTRIGVGFVNRDGSITLRLDCIPLSGTLQVREWEPYDRRPDQPDSPSPNGAARRPADFGEAGSRSPRQKVQPGPGESLV